MLTVTLRQLERDGLVLRAVYPVVPPRVDYKLTALGGTVLETIQSLVAWTRQHRDEVAAARTAYDSRTNGHRQTEADSTRRAEVGAERHHLYTASVDRVYHLCMARTRTNLEIDDDILQTVMSRYRLATKTEAIDLALRRLAGRPMTRQEALAMRGAEALDEVPAEQPIDR